MLIDRVDIGLSITQSTLKNIMFGLNAKANLEI
jgi:hypothetical protein